MDIGSRETGLYKALLYAVGWCLLPTQVTAPALSEYGISLGFLGIRVFIIIVVVNEYMLFKLRQRTCWIPPCLATSSPGNYPLFSLSILFGRIRKLHSHSLLSLDVIPFLPAVS